NMSALPSEPGHFVAWLAGVMDGAEPASYAPRALYGEYLHEVLNEYTPNSAEIVHVRGSAVRLVRQNARWVVHLRDGQHLMSRNVIFALGNLPPADPIPFPDRPPAGYVGDPWSGALADGIPADAPLLLLGTGLTMVDVVLTLRAGGHRGSIHALSRHGRMH